MTITRRLATMAVVGAALFASTRSAHAAHVEAHLLYERGPGAESCADEEELRAAVAARLGYDPFVTKADVDTVIVRIRKVGGGLEGSIERRDAAQKPRGKPAKITSAKGDCGELLTAIAVGTA
ncbi:MAG TPA: hypothetical protein VM925_37180, partial [Labilithrix sp.]|nr:hypothetical protein [Labilithrix sp.]